ncbi:hypothetical protein F5B18DRAFT_486568 [Nemania serpens]|nr:hypothetical protein F5B18DRAFT_486568 [Nemania serpens]
MTRGRLLDKMVSHSYTDPPPSYAEATSLMGLNSNRNRNRSRSSDGNGNSNGNRTGNSSDTSQATVRRHTTTTTMFGPAYPPPTNTASRSRSEGGVAPLFPPCFDVYALGPRHLVIVGSGGAEHRGTEVPLYAVSTNSSLSLKPDLVVHSGISEDTPPLASIIHEPLSRSASIALPARETSAFPSVLETLESHSAFPRVLSFSIEISASASASGRPRREVFEWRRSSGGEVEALGGRHSGWKLVRVSAETATTTAKKARKHSHAHGESSDGRSVVAVWVGAGIFASRVLRFRFLGAGADGGFGRRWAVMAVASALAIWHRERRVRHRGLATASF